MDEHSAALVDLGKREQRYRAIDPDGFVRENVLNQQHVDGRPFDQCIQANLQMCVLSSALGSAVVKQGGTTVMCAITGELCVPSSELAPIKAFVSHSTNVPVQLATQVNMAVHHINSLLTKGNLLNTDQLLIEEKRLSWTLKADIHFITVDACVLDSSLLALVGALSDVQLPSVTLPPCDDTSKHAPSLMNLKATISLADKKPLVIQPIHCTTFTVYPMDSAEKLVLLAEPSELELSVCPWPVYVMVDEAGMLHGVHSSQWPGEQPQVHQQSTRKAVVLATKRAKQMQMLVQQAKIDGNKKK